MLTLSKFLLLQISTPDAIVHLATTKLKSEKKDIEEIYFEQQHHDSMSDFLRHHAYEDNGQLIQV